MAPTSDAAALENIDYYAFLSISPQATAAEIKTAGRKTSMKYHPDKVTPTPETLEKFHLLQVIIATLGDPAERTKYDQTREAKERRKAEINAMDAKRRAMVEDLEAREEAARNGVDPGVGGMGKKRTISERDMKIQRIAEENRKKMAEMAARKRQEKQISMAKERMEAMKNAPVESVGAQNEALQPGTSLDGDAVAGEVDTMDRCLRVRWICDEEGADIDEHALRAMAESPDDVEHILSVKRKKRKVEGKGKLMVGSAAIVFKTLSSAQDFKKQSHLGLESVEWAKGASTGDD